MSGDTIGFIGLGHMGGAIVRRLLAQGSRVLVFDINPEAVERMVAAGATPANSIRDVADRASLVLVCLPTGGSVDAAREAAGGGAIEIYAELSTMRRETAQQIADVMAAAGIAFVDGTVSGGVTVALRGELSHMMAGPVEAMARVAAAMAPVNAHSWQLSETPGHAQLCKLCNNAIGFTLFMASCEALAVGAHGGLIPAAMIEAINAGSGVNHWTRDKFGPHILSRTFDAGGKMAGGPPAFDLYLEEAARVGMPDGLIRAARDAWFDTALEFPDQTVDFTHLIESFERRAGTVLDTRPAPAWAQGAQVAPEPVVGFIGLGLMGGAIVRRLREQGVGVVVFDTSAETLSAFAALGVEAAASARGVADRAGLVFACLPSPAVSEAVAAEAAQGRALETYVELSTIGPAMSETIAGIMASRGVGFVDAPVTGGVARAARGDLVVLLAGPSPAADRAAAAASAFGTVCRLGTWPGQGQLCKIVNNALSFTALMASLESISVGVAAGIAPGVLTAAIAAGTGTSSATADKFPRVIFKRSFDLGGSAKGMLKDFQLYLDEAQRSGVGHRVVGAARDLAARAIEAVGQDGDASRIVLWFEGIVGAELRA